MIRLMHQNRRGPSEFVTVGSTRYELDAQGCVEVSQQHSEMLLQGAKWREPDHWQGRQQMLAAATPPPIQGGARRPRTPEELRAAAEASGITVAPPEEPQAASGPIVEPAPASGEAEADDDDEEPITVSLDMKKSELLAVARDLGLDVKQTMNKSQILDVIESAS